MCAEFGLVEVKAHIIFLGRRVSRAVGTDVSYLVMFR